MEANQIDLTMIDPLLTRLWAQNGTDLLVTAGTPPRVRVDGRLRALPGIAVVDPEEAETLISTTIGPELRAQLHVDKEIDFSFTWGSEARFRGNCFFQQGVPAMALRAETIETLAEELFLLETLGDDRAIAATYVAGVRWQPAT